MPIIQATTPTKAGWAQSFDTSGLAAIAAEEKDRRNKRLQELMVEYDTRGIWDRDTEHIQNKINEVNQFAMDHSKELANPSQNMKVWQEFDKMKSGVKNTVVYSIGAKEKFDKGNQKYNNSKHNMYMTDQNRDVLFNYSETPTAEQYADGSAWDDPEKSFNANLDIQPQKYVNLAGTFMKELPPEATGAVEGGRNVVESKYEMDQEKLTEALRPIFSSDTHEGASLQKQYGGDLNAFTRDVAAMTNKPSEYNLVAPRSTRAGGKRTAADAKRDYAVVPRTGSGFTTVETQYQGDGALAPITYLDEKGEQANAVTTYGITTVGGPDSTLAFAGDLRITKNIDQAYDMTKGTMLEPGEGKRYKYQVPLERSNYSVAAKDVTFTYKNKDGQWVKNTLGKDEAAPDFEKMLEAEKITKNEYNRLFEGGFITSMDGYIVYGSNEAIDYFDLAEGQDPMDMLGGKGGRLFIVPASSLSQEVDQQLGYKHDTNQAYYGSTRPQYNIMNVQ